MPSLTNLTWQTCGTSTLLRLAFPKIRGEVFKCETSFELIFKFKIGKGLVDLGDAFKMFV